MNRCCMPGWSIGRGRGKVDWADWSNEANKSNKTNLSNRANKSNCPNPTCLKKRIIKNFHSFACVKINLYICTVLFRQALAAG